MAHSATIYHIARRIDWEAALQAHAAAHATAYAAAHATQDGYIHCSLWRQLTATARTHFAGRTDLLVLEIDVAAVESALRMETAADGADYPHLYAPIPLTAVLDTLELKWGTSTDPEFVRSWPIEPDAMTLRPARPNEIDVLTLLNLQLREDEGYTDHMDRAEVRARMGRFLAGADGHKVFCLSATRGNTTERGRIVGYAVVDTARRPPYLRQLFVQRGARRHGAGSRAVELLRARLDSQAMDVEVLTANECAGAFWRKQGFAERTVGLRWSSGSPAAHTAPGARPARSDRGAVPVIQTITGTASDRTIATANTFILDNLRRYNNTESEHYRYIREQGAVQEIVVMLAEPEWVGGVRGSVYWNWLDVRYFWIAPQLRGKGHGTAMLAELERLAAARGALRARLSTFSFQARGFYERHGYRVVGEIADYPQGESLYWMRKDGLR